MRLAGIAHYHGGSARLDAWAVVVLELDRDHVAGWTSFLDAKTLFPRFGMPLQIDR